MTVQLQINWFLQDVEDNLSKGYEYITHISVYENNSEMQETSSK